MLAKNAKFPSGKSANKLIRIFSLQNFEFLNPTKSI